MASPHHIVWGGKETSVSSGSHSITSVASPKPEGVEYRVMSSQSLSSVSKSNASQEESVAIARGTPDKTVVDTCVGGIVPSPQMAASSSSAQRPPLVEQAAVAGSMVPQRHPLDDLVRPVLEKTNMWSLGSDGHASGDCKACHYIHSKSGCLQGAGCEFCHIPHTRSDMSKIGHNRRNYGKKFAKAVTHAFGNDPAVFDALVEHLSSRSEHLHSVFEDLRQRRRHQATKVSL